MSGSLREDLEKLEGRPYGFYRELARQSYDLPFGQLRFAHVQGDPFASPSRLAIDIGRESARLPEAALAGSDARRACADFLLRALGRRLAGSRKPGAQRGAAERSPDVLEIAEPGPEVLERSAVRVAADGAVRVLLAAGLPAQGRRILGREAAELLCARLGAALQAVFDTLDVRALEAHVRSVEDQVALRAALREHGLVAFVADGSVLPRRAGNDARPLLGAVPCLAPDSLACELTAPHAGRLRGLGVRQGVTLIVGGGYHGKSTLLDALALGVYDHVPGDGRERVATRSDCVSVRAEDGRAVRGVDLRPFIGPLPHGRRTECFSSENASGSTSQAAAISEALEVGARVLLIDEDTAASNFMTRDARMRRLIPARQEPITSYADRVRWLWEERGISSVLVAGGSGDWLDAADSVIELADYRLLDATARAREVAVALPLPAAPELPPPPVLELAPRIPDPESLDARRGRGGRVRVRGRGMHAIEFGRQEIDVSALAQLVDPAQCRWIGDALLALASGPCDGRRSVAELLDALEARTAEAGIEALAEPGFGDRAAARRFEIAAALNRLRSLRLAEPRSFA
jgi:predicted ABC-class ATPase